MPKLALPSVLDSASMRGSGWPISLNLAGSFSATLWGTGCFAASAASSPKLAFLPLGCITLLFVVLHSAAGSFHCCAAAPINIARAAAPASRIGSHRSLMLVEPPVTIDPISRIALAVIQPATAFTVPWLSGWNGRPSTITAMLL